MRNNETAEDIIKYLASRYDPLSVIVYGSWADGSNNAGSDFDALVITRGGERGHDTSFVGGVQLDAFIYPESSVGADADCDEFSQIWDGEPLLDTDGIGAELIGRVNTWLDSRPEKTAEELRADIAWCRKMLTRAGRGDAEGFFRLHWLLTDSLEIFCQTLGWRYLGPKKSLRRMSIERPEAFEVYSAALAGRSPEDCERWVELLEALL